jgi:hypothetical protein
VGQNASMKDFSGELSQAQSLPILQVLAKIHPVVAVQSPALNKFRDFPHVCWMSADEGDMASFSAVATILPQSETKSRWFMTYEIPYFCMLAQPAEAGAHQWIHSRESFSDSEILEVHKIAIQEIPTLVSFIEQRLALREKPILGLDLERKSLRLPGITDYFEPHAKNIYLVADPDSFSPYHGNVTSEYDRVLHYGLTDEEILAVQSAAKSEGASEYKVLPNFFYEPYKDQKVLPADVRRLENECLTFKQRTSDARIIRALDKLLSVAESAHRYNLGIYLDSD